MASAAVRVAGFTALMLLCFGCLVEAAAPRFDTERRVHLENIYAPRVPPSGWHPEECGGSEEVPLILALKQQNVEKFNKL